MGIPTLDPLILLAAVCLMGIGSTWVFTRPREPLSHEATKTATVLPNHGNRWEPFRRLDWRGTVPGKPWVRDFRFILAYKATTPGEYEVEGLPGRVYAQVSDYIYFDNGTLVKADPRKFGLLYQGILGFPWDLTMPRDPTVTLYPQVPPARPADPVLHCG